MPTNFPSGLDNFTNPTAADNLNSVLVPHADQHSNENDAIEALEAKVGIDGSLVTGSLDYRVTQVEGSTHSPVTLGTANGLILSGQQLSMGLAGATATGTLSATDWNTFNNKQSSLTFPLVASLGGTSVANTGTFTNHSNTIIIGGGTVSLGGYVLTIGGATTITGGGTLALGGFTLTVPATGTAALLATANVFTANQKINANSTTALLVEQDGVKDNVLVVDTTNARIGVSVAAPDSRYKIQVSESGGVEGAKIGAIEDKDYTGLEAGESTTKNGGLYWRNALERLEFATFSNAYPIAFSGSAITFSSAGNYTMTGASGVAIMDISGSGGNGGTIVLKCTTATGFSGFNINNNSGTLVASVQYGNPSASAFTNEFVIATRSSAIPLIVYQGGTGAANKRLTLNSTVNTFANPTTTANAVKEILAIEATVSTASTGSSNGFGAGLSWYAETATDGTNQQQGLISTSWIDATNASRKAKMSLSAYDTAARLGIEIEASGTAAKLGFYGVATVIRATNAGAAGAFVANTSGIADDTATFGGYTLGQIVQALINIGILT